MLKSIEGVQRDAFEAVGLAEPAQAPLLQGDRAKLVAGLQAVLNKVDPKAPLDPGRVTARRLNRVEYSRTVRDLCQIDFDPSEDFPSDDIGHGFDNIGDVLTLSPVLMEPSWSTSSNRNPPPSHS